MSFAREGYPFIGIGVLLAGAGWVAVWGGIGGNWVRLLAITLTLLTLFTVWFFRDPEPGTPTEPGLVIAPGNGKIISITEEDEPTYMGGKARRITIFLSVFDVHVQRSPVSGTVEHRVYKPGKYLVAWAEKASSDNEQASLGIRTPSGPVLVRQIAGLIARRIVTDHAVGDEVLRGHRIGIIRFGSRVDLFIPLDWEVVSSVGDRVRVGSTVLARHPVDTDA
ncbi:MAG: phosphatidylserine decarboxylase family protein [Gemmatimonadales bacterium]|nr:phosphatidylserine decarboxylase family protein [Gemmatimonadales bacterium]MDG2238913.1 phosphatidylserine decarboxylase family protein [Longimicrobiales bacterium]NCG34323.1 phosphatidylserine decarboxylase family protein [Pseudomonadota bacterium]MBT3499061.1 phosphatidylserine decarboxylase family protein [Gemmatimonadales bacterium]MBT3774205.1 phosphatidylserine decarboxylase family protein [Gemmatimonadales bacterium]